MKTKEIEKEWESLYSEADLSSIPRDMLKPPSRLVYLVQSLSSGRALDLGCGFGVNSQFLSSKGFSVFALDISKSALRLASVKAKANFVQASSHELPFDSSSFSLLVDIGCFHHLPEKLRKSHIAEAHRTLVDDGTYFLECFSSRSEHDYGSRFTKSEIEKLFSPFFKIESIEEQRNEGMDGHVYVYTAIMKKLV